MVRTFTKGLSASFDPVNISSQRQIAHGVHRSRSLSHHAIQLGRLEPAKTNTYRQKRGSRNIL